MNKIVRLEPLERRVLLSVPGLFPDGDSSELTRIKGASEERISYAIKHLIDLRLVSAVPHEGVHPFAPYFLDVELTSDGEQLARDLGRPWLVRFWDREWRWVLSNAITAVALVLSLWNFFHK